MIDGGNDFKEKRAVKRTIVYNTQASLQTGISSENEGSNLQGVVVNLSSQGCCLLLHSDVIPTAFSFCRITIGNQILVPSQVRWVKEVEKGIYKVGVRYQI